MERHEPDYSTRELVKLDYLETLTPAQRAFRLFLPEAITNVIANGEQEGLLSMFSGLDPEDQAYLIHVGKLNSFLDKSEPARAQRVFDIIEALPKELRIETLAKTGWMIVERGFVSEYCGMVAKLDVDDKMFVLEQNAVVHPSNASLLASHGGREMFLDFIEDMPEKEKIAALMLAKEANATFLRDLRPYFTTVDGQSTGREMPQRPFSPPRPTRLRGPFV